MLPRNLIRGLFFRYRHRGRMPQLQRKALGSLKESPPHNQRAAKWDQSLWRYPAARTR